LWWSVKASIRTASSAGRWWFSSRMRFFGVWRQRSMMWPAARRGAAAYGAPVGGTAQPREWSRASAPAPRRPRSARGLRGEALAPRRWSMRAPRRVPNDACRLRGTPFDQSQYRLSAIPSRRHCAAMLSSPRSPSSTTRILSSAERRLRSKRRMSRTTRSAGALTEVIPASAAVAEVFWFIPTPRRPRRVLNRTRLSRGARRRTISAHPT
jgi:hypothetical protein